MVFTVVTAGTAAETTPGGDMQLPLKIPYDLMLTKWASIINPLLSAPLNQVSILKGISLIIGETKIPHLLGDMQRGWWVIDINGVATIYRSKPLESSFLYLTSSAVVTVNLGVF